MNNQVAYMYLSRFLDLVKRRSFSDGTGSRMEFLLYQLNLAILRQERSLGDEKTRLSVLYDLEPLNRLLADGGEGRDARGDIDRELLNGLMQIVKKMGGDNVPYRSNR